ncbi:MAG: tetratricopeptide repeat protein [Candidatus Omnitrophota bacterium]
MIFRYSCALALLCSCALFLSSVFFSACFAEENGGAEALDAYFKQARQVVSRLKDKVSALQKEIGQKENNERENAAAIAALRKKIKDQAIAYNLSFLKFKKEQQQYYYDRLRKIEDDFGRKNNILVQRLADMQKENAALKDDIARIRKDLEDKVRYQNEMAGTIRGLEKQKARIDKEKEAIIRDKELSLAYLKRQIRKLSRENRAVTQLREEKADILREKEKEADYFRRQIEKYKQKNSDREKEISALNIALSDKQADYRQNIFSLNKTIEDNRREHEQTVAALKETIENNRAEYNRAIAAWEEEKRNLSLRISGTEDKYELERRKILDKYKDIVEGYRLQLKELAAGKDKRILKLEGDLRKKDKVLRRLREEFKSLAEQKTVFEQKIEKLEGQLQAAGQKYVDLENTLKKKEKDVTAVSARLTEALSIKDDLVGQLKQEADKYKTEKEGLLAKISKERMRYLGEIEGLNKQLKQEADKYKTEKEGLLAKISKERMRYLGEIEGLNKQLGRERKEYNSRLKQTSSAREKEIAELKAQADEQDRLGKKRNIELEKKNAALVADVRNREGKNKQLQQVLERQKQEIASLNDSLAEYAGKIASYRELSREKEKLADKISAMKIGFRKERGSLYYYLGLAYTQAKVFDEAIKAYERSLSFTNDNAEVYYNLGLLYQYYRNDKDAALKYLQRYMQLNPHGRDRQRIQSIIETIGD